jgi:predicted RNA binding protein YcfA (HicA-like mRNA interferase family)
VTPKLPSVSARRVVRALERAGYAVARSSGSHCILARSGDPARSVVVPVHGSRDLKLGTLRAIIRQAGLTVEEFVGLL